MRLLEEGGDFFSLLVISQKNVNLNLLVFPPNPSATKVEFL
jgi:hypothetical protein